MTKLKGGKRGQVYFPALDLGRPRGLSPMVIMNLTPFRTGLVWTGLVLTAAFDPKRSLAK